MQKVSNIPIAELNILVNQVITMLFHNRHDIQGNAGSGFPIGLSLHVWICTVLAVVVPGYLEIYNAVLQNASHQPSCVSVVLFSFT